MIGELRPLQAVAAMNHALEKKESHKNVADSTFVGHALKRNANFTLTVLGMRDLLRRIKLDFYCSEFENSSTNSSRTCVLESNLWFQS